jgi:hypothetical protein
VPSTPDAWTTLYSSDMLRALRLLSQLRNEARTIRPDIQVALTREFVGLERDLVLLSERISKFADERIRAKIRSTQKRPPTEHPVHLLDVIKSEPLPLGGVAIGVLDELNKLENPESGGVYWRTQEEGSVAVGNKMTGRILYGRFVGPGGYSEAPSRISGGFRPGSEFLFGDLSGDAPGFGTIQHEIEPRHFLRDGSLEAFAEYRREITGLSRRYATRLAGIGALAAV